MKIKHTHWEAKQKQAAKEIVREKINPSIHTNKKKRNIFITSIENKPGNANATNCYTKRKKTQNWKRKKKMAARN